MKDPILLLKYIVLSLTEEPFFYSLIAGRSFLP